MKYRAPILLTWLLTLATVGSLCTLVIWSKTETTTESSVTSTHSTLEIVETIKTYPTLTPTTERLRNEQEDIRNEIFYGELEPVVLLVHAEAGNQDFLGKQLVAEVVFNRVRSPRFPDTIEEVINQPGQFSTAKSLEKWAWGHLTQDDFDAVLEAYFNPTNDRILYFDSIGGVNGRNHFKHGGHWFGE